MRVAASLGEKNAQTTTDLKTRLAQGDTLEVGGYDISPALARQLESAELLPWLDGSRSQLLWLDVVPHGDTELAPATSDFVRQARSKGVRVVAVAIAAEPFWMSAELVRVPALVARTVSAIVTPP
jgi:hypothetical protein